MGQAVGEIIEVDGGEEVVGAAGLGAVVSGWGLLMLMLLLLLSEDGAWLRDCARGRARECTRGWRGPLLLLLLLLSTLR